MKNILITSLFIIGVLFSGPYEVGNLVEDFSGEYCFPENVGEWSLYDNLYENNGGIPLIIWLVIFDANNFTSRTEASFTEYLYNFYKDQGLTVVGIGANWARSSFSCRSWGEEFGITYPILDDNHLNIRSLFTEGNPPHHVLINHNMRVLYSESGTVLDVDFLDLFQEELNFALENLNSLSSRENFIIPNKAQLNQCYPNPFNPSTTIIYDLSENSHVSLMVYDVNGREIKHLVNSLQEPGANKTVIWNGIDSQNKPVGGGVYFYQLRIEEYIDTRKMVLLK